MSDEPSESGPAAQDDLLVVQARTDRVAFGLLFDRYYPRVLRYCMRRVIDRAAAEDLTSEVFLKVAANLRRFAGTTETDFRRWLFRIATNQVVASLRQSHRRREIRDALVHSGHLSPLAQDAAVDHDRLDWPAVQDALSDLGERDQAIVSLRFFAGLSCDEIAEVVEMKSGAVRTALSRALARLRERFSA